MRCRFGEGDAAAYTLCCLMTRKQISPIEPELIVIPAGNYPVGTGDDEMEMLSQQSSIAAKWREKGYFKREQPAHQVQLSAFSIGRFPVSVAEFRVFVADGAHERPELWGTPGWRWLKRGRRTRPDYWADAKWTGEDRLPVVGVSWYEALAYCRWLKERSGRLYRLATEAEWEAAARGPDGRLYPWGGAFDAARCNCRASGIGQTLVSGSYGLAGNSPYGVSDMVGNVSEWVMSLYLPYPITLGDGRDDADVDGARVIRGGSWFSPQIRARATARGMNDPGFSDNDLGFRCASGPSDHF